jgi:small subunit ribosomal protein S27Ae
MAGEGKKQKKPHKYTPKYKYYKVEAGKVARTLKSCPRCGAGTLMANHKDREYCGRCHYTVFKDQAKAPQAPPAK